jgi:putative ABC transport system permease protein
MWLLSRLISKQKNYGLFGDMEEIYNFQVVEKGRIKADLWFWLQVGKTIPASLLNSLYWSSVMFNNYLKITFRNFKRQKAYSIINVTGLAVGMACFICILVYVHHELSYDRFHANADNICRLVMKGNTSGSPFDVALSSGPIGPTMVKDFPEVDKAVRFQRRERIPVNYEKKQFLEEGIFYADETVFDVFTFSLLKGNPDTALKNPFSAVIIRETARRYFGSANPLGKILRFNQREDYAVTGVMEDVPENSHINFDFLLSYETLLAANRSQTESWTQFTNYTYLLLKEGANPREIEKKIPALNAGHMGFDPADMGWNLIFALQPLKSIHLHSNLQGEIKENGDIAYIYIFSSIAVFILLLACINFMNLATARSSNRAKEMGMRKVLGASRGKLIKQFLGESLIYSFLSLLLALILVEFAIPALSSLSGHTLDVRYTEIPWLIPGTAGIAIFAGLTAGIYPSLILASFQPAHVIKRSPGSAHQRRYFRSVLVTFQLAVSTFLIIATGIILRQNAFMKNKKLGFDKERVIVLQIVDDSVRQSIAAVKQELKNLPGVLDVTATSHIPGWGGLAAAHLPEGFSMENTQIMRIIHTDHDFLNTMGIELVAGRNFSPEFPGDPQRSVLINETAAKKFGWDNPLGKRIQQIYGNKQIRVVVGVVKDFHMSSLHNPIEPMFINNSFPAINAVCVRTGPGNIKRTLDSIRATWKNVIPNAPFEYSFLDESFDKQYRAEERLSRLFSYFSLLAIFIACLGLCGMACYSAEKRTKEIGIRKVLGASASGIVLMFSRDLIKLFITANVVVWPIVYAASQKWLQNFAYRTNIGIDIFLLSALLILVITLGTVSYQAIKAALANPVDSLRYE